METVEKLVSKSKRAVPSVDIDTIGEDALSLLPRNSASIADALKDIAEDAFEIGMHVQWAHQVERCKIGKGRHSTTVKQSSNEDGRKVLIGTFVGGLFIVTSDNKELVEVLRYNTAAASDVLLRDGSSDVIAAVPFNRVAKIKREGVLLYFTYLAHTTFVHVGPSSMVNSALMALPHNPLQKSVGNDYLHTATLTCSSEQVAEDILQHLQLGLQHFNDALSWLRLGFPLKTEVIPTAILVPPFGGGRGGGGVVLDPQPQFCKPFELPQQWDSWVKSGEARSIAVHLHSPLGPVLALIRPSNVKRALEGMDPQGQPTSNTALFKVVGRPIHAEVNGRTQVSKVALQAGTMPSASEESARDDKVIMLHVKCWPEQRPASPAPVFAGAAPGSLAQRHAAPGGVEATAAAGGLSREPVATVALALVLPWALSGFSPEAGTLMLKVAVLVALALGAARYLQAQQQRQPPAQRKFGTGGSSVGEEARPVVKRWMAELLLAQVTQYVAEEEMAGDIGDMRSHPSRSLVEGGMMATLMETKPTESDSLAPEFKELMSRSPWVTADVVTRFVKGMGSEAAGYDSLRETVEWRLREGVDDVLQRPIRIYEPFKRLGPHSLHCASVGGSPVILLKAGECATNFDKMLTNGLGVKDLEEYFVWMLEWCLSKYDTRPWPKGVFDVLIDVQGVKMSHFGGQRLRAVNACLGIFEKHYKERLGSAIVLHAPGWWGFIWRIISPLLPKAVLDKIQVTTSDATALEAMCALMGKDKVPREYGGSCGWALGDSPWDKEQRAAIEACNREAGIQ